MISSQVSEDVVQVALVAVGSHPGLAVGPLSQHFGLKTTEAEVLLARGCGVIASRVPRFQASAAVPVLAALGLQVAILPMDAVPLPERFDLSIRVKDSAAIPFVRQVLKRSGCTYEAKPEDFFGPAGLEITDLAQVTAEDCAAALRAGSGVSVRLCAQSQAVYDVFFAAGRSSEEMARVLKHVSLLALSPMDHCPAIAAGLDRRMLTYLLACFPEAGLIGVNQVFQRYDLSMRSLGRLSILDLSDFLATRGLATKDALKAVRSPQGLRLDAGLSRAAALQFVADYAMIGLSVRADLVRA